MKTARLLAMARAINTSITLVADPTADPKERWVAVVGLDAYGAARTPASALRAALADLPQHGTRHDTAPSILRSPLVLRTALK